MSDIDALKKRKEQLLLEREVARLERKASFQKFTGSWSWLWIVPLAIIGTVFFIAGIANVATQGGEAVGVILVSALAIAPFILKVLNR